eukprot:PhF_6_TR33836/c0_g1_i2/m.49625
MPTLVVTILGVRGAKSVDLLSKSDIYVTVTWGDVTKQTKTIDNNNDPDFNEEMKLTVGSSVFPTITIEVFDADPVTKDDSLGKVRVPITGLKKGIANTQWLSYNAETKSSTVGFTLLAKDFGEDPIDVKTAPEVDKK